MNSRLTKSLISIALAFSFTLAKAQTAPAKQWDATFGGSDWDELNSLQQTSDEGYILGGLSYSGISGDKTQASRGERDYWIVKTDAYGVKEWDARFGGESADLLTWVQQTADGGYILGGYSWSGISGDKTQAGQGSADYWIVKTDAHGVKQWDARFGGTGDDWLTALQQTSDGGYILGGFSDSGISGDKTQESQGENDYWIVKTDASGIKEWDARFGGNSIDRLSAVLETSDGGYILGGWSTSGKSGDKTQGSRGDNDYWIVKTDANGIKQWDARFGGSQGDYFRDLRQVTDGGYILGGDSNSGISDDKTQPSQGYNDYWIVKTDENGEEQWDATFGGSDAEYFHCIQQTSDGGYVVGGFSASGISGDKTQASQGIHDYWIVKTDSVGAKQWDARYGGSDYDYLESFQQTSDGGYILGGWSNSGISGDKTQTSQGSYDYWIVKLTSESCTVPSNLSVTNITSSSAKLKWDSVSGAEAYKIRYMNSNTEETTQNYALGNSKVIDGLSPNTAYAWQVKTICQVTPNASSDWSATKTFVTELLRMSDESPQQISFRIYPNPAKDYATIQFTLRQSIHISINVYDVSGREVMSLLNDDMQQGDHTVELNTTQFSKGIYMVKMISDAGTENQKLIVE